jgi:hypothetical protein
MRSLVAKLVLGTLLVSGLTFMPAPAQASALPTVTNMCRSTGNGATYQTSATSNGFYLDSSKNLRITPIFSKRMYVDGSRNFNATYIGYRVTNTGTVAINNLTIELTGFTGGVISPATDADSFRRIGTLDRLSSGAAATANVYFFMKASGATDTTQRHDVRIYTDDGVTKTQQTSCYTETLGVERSLAASANKVTSITVTGTPALGETVVVTVKGAPGKVGQGESPDGSIIALSPASYASWPSKAVRLENVSLKVFGIQSTSAGNACILGTNDGYTQTPADTVYSGGTDKLIEVTNRLIIRNFDKCATSTKQTYEINYTFRVTGLSTVSPAIVPLASISSGTQIKYTGSLPASTTTIPLTETTFPLNVNKTFVSSAKSGSNVDVTYRITAATSSASAIPFQQFRDEPDPAATFVSATFTDNTRTSATSATRTATTVNGAPVWRFTPASGDFAATSSRSAILTYVVRYAIPTVNTVYRNLGYVIQNDVVIGATGLTTGIDAAITPSGDVTPVVVNQKSPQTISFDPPTTMGNNTTIILNAFSDSSLAVTFETTTPTICGVRLVSGVWSLFSLAEGTCTVVAKQSGNDSFNPATDVSKNITVLKGQVITPNSPSFSGASNTTTLEVTATSKLEVTVVSLDTDVCTVAQSVAHNATTGLKSYTVTKPGSLTAGSCLLLATQSGNGEWGPAPEKNISIGFGASQFLSFLSSSPSEPVGGFASTQTSFTVTFTSVTTSGGTTRTGLPVSLTSLTPAVCLVQLAVVDGELESGFNGTDTTVTVTRQGPGLCTLEASQDGFTDAGVASTYAPASNIQKSFTLKAAGTQIQTVAFEVVPTKTYGDASFFAFVTSKNSSNVDTTLLVTVSSTTESICVVGSSVREGEKSKAEVFILQAGTCSLTGTQSGNETYSIATGTTSFTVSKKQLTVTGLSSSSREYDGTKTATISGTPALSGVVPGDSPSDVAISGTATVADFVSEFVGSETLQVSGLTINGNKASSSYTLVQPQVTGTITTRVITIKFNNLNANSTPEQFCLPNVAVTVGSLAVGDTLTSISCDLPSYGSGYSNGTFTITPSGAAIDNSSVSRITNYSISYLSGSLVVSTMAVVVLETPDLEVVYGTVLTALESSADMTDDPTKVRAKKNGALEPGSISHRKNGNLITANLPVGVHNVDVEFTPTDSANVLGQSKTRKITVKPRKLLVTGYSVIDKVYDGSRTVTLSGSSSLIADPDGGAQGLAIMDGDTVTMSGTATAEFSSEDVGTSRSVTLNGLSKGGESSANYEVRMPTLSANITKRPLKIGPAQLTYSKLRGATDPTLATTLLEGTSFAPNESADTLGGVQISRAAGEEASTSGYRVFLTVGSSSGKDNYEVEVTETLMFIADASINVSEVNGVLDSDVVECNCQGFKPGTTVTLTMFSSPTLIKSDVVTDDGTCPLLSGTLPEDSSGTHTLEISSTFPNGDPLVLNKSITFSAASNSSPTGTQTTPSTSWSPKGDRSTLSITGFDGSRLLSASGALVFIGSFFVMLGRARRKTDN